MNSTSHSDKRIAKLNESTMTKARILFCEKYLEKYDVVASFRHAYPGVAVANGNYYPKARKLLKRRDCQMYLLHRRADMQEIMCLDANRIAQELAAVAFTDITDVMSDVETVKDFDDMSPTAKKAIKKISVKEVANDRGVTRTVTLELHDKLRSLSELMKVLGIGGGDAQVVNGDVTVNNNTIQVKAEDLTTAQLKQLASNGQLSFDEEPDEFENMDVIIDDEDFS